MYTFQSKQTLDMLHHFNQCTCLKLNKYKTEAFQLGVVSRSIDSKHALKWDAKNIKVTGFTVGKHTKMLNYNFFTRRERVKS